MKHGTKSIFLCIDGGDRPTLEVVSGFAELKKEVGRPSYSSDVKGLDHMIPTEKRGAFGIIS